jgi:hypothetical protein
MRRLVLLGLVLVLFLSAGAALATGEGGGGFEIPRWAIAGGGGRSETRSYALRGTIGQAVVGTGSGGSYDVCSGFWSGPCGWDDTRVSWIYLPVVIRNQP